MPAKKKTAARNDPKKGFTAEEKAAMKERAKELKANATREEGEKALLEKIAEMKGKDKTIGKKLHSIVTSNAPDLMPKTWYGMPAYATSEGKVLCFYQPAGKFGSRYATLGFTDEANLDKDAMWATTFALTDLSGTEEKKVVALVKKAVS